ncbi:MAG: cytosolic protein [Planctomycetaceae bacterium]
MNEFDSPWKEVVERYFEPFMKFYFPIAHRQIDWTYPVEFLDKELQRVVRNSRQKRRIVDKLARVRLLDGREEWVLIHLEIQGTSEADFAERMYVCNYRLFDRYHRRVASMAVLTDSQTSWRPSHFGYELLGCQIRFDFPIVKLSDYRAELAKLREDRTPFAILTVAHLRTIETQKNPKARKHWKLQIVKSLYAGGFQRQDVIELFRVIDWMMELPSDLSIEFDNDVAEFEEGTNMKYVTSIERNAIERSRQEGRQEGLLEAVGVSLEFKFGDEAKPLLNSLRKIKDDKLLCEVQRAVLAGLELPGLKKLLAKGRS